MNEECNDFLREMVERDWLRYVQRFGEFEGEREEDGFSERVVAEVRDELEIFEGYKYEEMRERAIRAENERELEHGLRTLCMN